MPPKIGPYDRTIETWNRDNRDTPGGEDRLGTGKEEKRRKHRMESGSIRNRSDCNDDDGCNDNSDKRQLSKD